MGAKHDNNESALIVSPIHFNLGLLLLCAWSVEEIFATHTRASSATGLRVYNNFYNM